MRRASGGKFSVRKRNFLSFLFLQFVHPPLFTISLSVVFHSPPLFLIPLSYYLTKHYFPLLTSQNTLDAIYFRTHDACEKVSSRRWRLCRNQTKRRKKQTHKCPPLSISIPSPMISYTYFYDVTTPLYEEKN